MLTISVWPRRLKEFLLTHPLYKSPIAAACLKTQIPLLISPQRFCYNGGVSERRPPCGLAQRSTLPAGEAPANFINLLVLSQSWGWNLSDFSSPIFSPCLIDATI